MDLVRKIQVSKLWGLMYLGENPIVSSLRFSGERIKQIDQKDLLYLVVVAATPLKNISESEITSFPQVEVKSKIFERGFPESLMHRRDSENLENQRQHTQKMIK